jgi:hypothetical protein
MPRSRIAFWAALLAWPSFTSAQQVSAITDFLKPIVSKIASDPNSGGWTWETNRNGGYLVRKSMDVTGDGQPELFVASTLQSTKHEQTWTVFDVAKDGTLRPYRTTLQHSSAWPIVEGDKMHLVYVLPPDKERMRESDEKPYPVSRFTFVFPEIKETLTYVSEAEATKFRPSDLGQLPKLQAILLADYLTKPEAKWADVTEWNLDANDSFFRVEDKERAAKNTAFTPEVALSKLGVVQSSSASSSEQTTGNQPPPVVKPEAPKKAPESRPAAPTPSEEPASSTPWSIIVVLIVAAIGLLWLLLKGRK